MKLQFLFLIIILSLCGSAMGFEAAQPEPIYLGLTDQDECIYEQLPAAVKTVNEFEKSFKLDFLNASLEGKLDFLDRIFDKKTQLLLKLSSSKVEIFQNHEVNLSEKSLLIFRSVLERKYYSTYGIKSCKKSLATNRKISVWLADWLNSTLSTNGLLESLNEQIDQQFGQGDSRLTATRIMVLYGIKDSLKNEK